METETIEEVKVKAPEKISNKATPEKETDSGTPTFPPIDNDDLRDDDDDDEMRDALLPFCILAGSFILSIYLIFSNKTLSIIELTFWIAFLSIVLYIILGNLNFKIYFR